MIRMFKLPVIRNGIVKILVACSNGTLDNYTVNGTFKLLRVAGYDFSKDWEDQTEKVHAQIRALLAELVESAQSGKESEHFAPSNVLEERRKMRRKGIEAICKATGGLLDPATYGSDGATVVLPNGERDRIIFVDSEDETSNLRKQMLEKRREEVTEVPIDPTSIEGLAGWKTKFIGKEGKEVGMSL